MLWSTFTRHIIDIVGWVGMPVAPLCADVRAYCSHVKIYCKRVRLLSSHPRLFIHSFIHSFIQYLLISFISRVCHQYHDLILSYKILSVSLQISFCIVVLTHFHYFQYDYFSLPRKFFFANLQGNCMKI